MNSITKVIHENKRQFAIYILSCLAGTTGVSLLMNGMYGFLFGMMDSVNELTAHSFAVIIAIIAVIAVLMLLTVNCQLNFIMSRMLRIKDKLFDSIMRLTYKAFARKPAAHYMSEMINDAGQFEDRYFEALKQMLSGAGDVFAGLAILLVLDLRLFTFAFIGVAVIGIAGAFFRKKSVKLGADVAYSNERSMEVCENTFMGLEVIRMSNVVESFRKKCYDSFHELEKNKEKNGFYIHLWSGVLSNVGNIMMLVGLLYVTEGIAAGRLRIGQAGFAVTIFNMAVGSTTAFLAAYNSYSTVAWILKEEQSDSADTVAGGEKFSFNSRIKLEKVEFAYEDRLVLQIDLAEIKKGGKYLIRGRSGSGKSTLFRLMTGVYDGYKGQIFYDNVELRKLDKVDFNRHVSVIHQDVFLFEDTLRNNICLYENYTEAEISEAVRRAGLSDVVDRLADGLDTLLSENGKELSGGERQRISIARAVIRKVDILFADEVNASLPQEMAQQLENMLLGLDMTVLIISHRDYSGENELYDGVIEL